MTKFVTGPDLWELNSPEKFWLCEPPIKAQEWQEAIRRAVPQLGLSKDTLSTQELLYLSLGEGRFGPDHWSISARLRLYYLLKPALPRILTKGLRRLYTGGRHETRHEYWPTDPRFAAFQWEVLRQLLAIRGERAINYRTLWPERRRFAFVLTHDIETSQGQAFVRQVADLEEQMGFRSSFNFVLERYPLDVSLMEELRRRGFEVGCHGLKHDGKLFNSEPEFRARAALINSRMQDYGMVGFRSPLTLRNPQWMQQLEIEYDSSFFDTDPFEPIPGGVMTIWPFFLGRFVELPYTLVQDYALAAVLGARTADIWINKVQFIREHGGMALINTHPDYLRQEPTRTMYADLLQAAKSLPDYWHALPRDVAAWWRKRADATAAAPLDTFSTELAASSRRAA